MLFGGHTLCYKLARQSKSWHLACNLEDMPQTPRFQSHPHTNPLSPRIRYTSAILLPKRQWLTRTTARSHRLSTTELCECRRSRRHRIPRSIPRCIRCLGKVEKDLPVLLPSLFFSQPGIWIEGISCLFELDFFVPVGLSDGAFGSGGFERVDCVGEIDYV